VQVGRRRRQAPAAYPLFARTELIEDPDEFARRLPFMATKRNFSQPVALNWAADGVDVDFGVLSGQLIGYGVRNGSTVPTAVESDRETTVAGQRVQVIW
jgi:malate dehydrogenase (quinone)